MEPYEQKNVENFDIVTASCSDSGYSLVSSIIDFFLLEKGELLTFSGKNNFLSRDSIWDGPTPTKFAIPNNKPVRR